MARTQAPELSGPERLQAPHAVTDLYSPPPRPVIDNRLGDLSDALSGFNTELRRFAATAAKTDSAAQQAEAQKFIASNSNEQIKAAVREGRMPSYSDPIAQGAVQRDYGDRIGREISLGVERDIQSGKINLLDPNVNLDDIVTERMKGGVEQINSIYPQSKFAATALAGHATTLRGELIKKQGEARVKLDMDNRLGVVENKFNDFIAEADQVGRQPNGLVPKEAALMAHDKIRAAYGELNKTLGLPNNWMDDKLYKVLQDNAKEHPEIVFGILNERRKDEKGNPLPSLADKPLYAEKVKQLLNTLRPAMAKKQDDVIMNDTVQSGIDAINRQDGSYWSLHDMSYKNDFSGENKVIDADTIRKHVMARYQTWSDRVAADRGERPDVKFDREFPVFEKANVANPVWKRTLEGISTSLTSPSALSNPDERAKLGQAGELYLNLSAKNYSYIKNTINLPSHSQNFYDVYEVGRRYMGLNQDQATDTAATAVNQRETASDLAVQVAQRQKIVQKVGSEFAAGTFSWLTGSGASNLADAQKRLTEIASVLVRVNGVSTDDAVENAAKLLKDRSYIINGHVVHDEGFMPPADVKPGVETALKQFFDKDGKSNGVTSLSELSIRPDGAGNFTITKDAGGFHVPVYTRIDDKAVPAKITMDELYRLRALRSQEGDQKIIQKQGSAIERNAGTDDKLSSGVTQPVNRQQQQRLDAIKRGRELRDADMKQRNEGLKVLSDDMRTVWGKVSGAGDTVLKYLKKGIEGQGFPGGVDPNVLGPAK